MIFALLFTLFHALFGCYYSVHTDVIMTYVYALGRRNEVHRTLNISREMGSSISK
jgi:hypothetical protein